MSTMLQLEKEIKKTINGYLDQMPDDSRVTYIELSVRVRENLLQLGLQPPVKLIDVLCHDVVPSRQDLLIIRGVGILKVKT